ncbi:hypothetical protein EDP1_1445 [Pseudomonas putida S610]|uniref:HipA N-terminal domain-containing protein n=1 Tax=Pseudomonas putida group TaxID=136845 RepID=UPI0003C5B8D1|nr:HipA N-terminal domain-containing protein [Pseudomonas putida]EST14479.1 hypothetical protein EDP1_1445 [Pseudomonas putida S610]
MQRAYIYMEHPESGQVLTLGRLTLKGKLGEFVYAHEYVAQGGWVPDPIHYPLRAEPYTGITRNRGIPGFINDAMPDGWGERLLHRVYGQALGTLDFLLKSPYNDRVGNSWLPALRDHYATFLMGADLDSACAAASSARMLS